MSVQPRHIVWPRNDAVLFTGRNGDGFCTGVQIMNLRASVDIMPITSRSTLGNCSIGLPADPVILKAIAYSLIAIANALPQPEKPA